MEKLLCRIHHDPMIRESVNIGKNGVGWYCRKCDKYYAEGNPALLKFARIRGKMVEALTEEQIETAISLQIEMRHQELQLRDNSITEKRKEEARKRILQENIRMERREIEERRKLRELREQEMKQQCRLQKEQERLRQHEIEEQKRKAAMPIALKDSFREYILPEKVDEIPASAIYKFVGVKKNDGKDVACVIVGDSHDACERKGILGKNYPFARQILVANTIGYGEFIFNGISYVIDQERSCFIDLEAERILRKFAEDVSSPKTIYLYSSINFEKNFIEGLEAVTAMVWCAGETFPVPMSILYSRTRDLFFLYYETYCEYSKKYGIPYLRIEAVANEGRGKTIFENFREQSELRIYGYTVSQEENPGTQGRRKLLEQLMNSGLMTKKEIISHLEWLIRMHKNLTNFENAVFDWRDDLTYVNEYKIEDQRVVWGKLSRHE